MTGWIIVRTDFRKEHYVASQIEAMGFAAWVPCQIIASRPAIARRVTSKAGMAIKHLPILPRRLFAAVPMWAIHQDELHGIRHYETFERDGDQLPVIIPDHQITGFRSEIDRENTAALALAQAKSRSQKAKWRSLHDALLEIIEQARQGMEKAA